MLVCQNFIIFCLVLAFIFRYTHGIQDNAGHFKNAAYNIKFYQNVFISAHHIIIDITNI